MSNINKIQILVEELNKCRNAYYNNNVSLLTDQKYDELFDELKELEEATGFILSNSPTQEVGYEVKSVLNKVKHNHPMLSLDKTKDCEDIRKFSNGKSILAMPKLDGLTISLTYEKGVLVRAETRGNGEIGEVVTHNAKVFDNIPLTLIEPYDLVVDGEAIITYDTFREINRHLAEEDQYKNPRNLVSGSVRQLDSKIAKDRHIKFIAWKMISSSFRPDSSAYDRLSVLKDLGFTVANVMLIEEATVQNIIEANDYIRFSATVEETPIDGVVYTYDDIMYGESLGVTSHHPKHSMAFKFYDEEVETTVTDIEWSMGKTGILTPVAIFEPVELDGTTVSRASVHNINIMEDLNLKVGDTITVYKANQIIPQIRDNLTKSDKGIYIPKTCPVCGGVTEVVINANTRVLGCTNSQCEGKLLGKLTHFSSKNAMNINGLSEATIDKFIELGYFASVTDIFDLYLHRQKLMELEGFGEQSVTKLLNNIEDSKNVTLDRFIYALAIPNVGRTASKELSKYFNGDDGDFLSCIFSLISGEQSACNELYALDGFGKVLVDCIIKEACYSYPDWCYLASEVNFIKPQEVTHNVENSSIKDKSFCITGKLVKYSNRDELVNVIESNGGKVCSGVTKNTDYLITNDVSSGSSKNKKAAQLNIPIITEQEFSDMANK